MQIEFIPATSPEAVGQYTAEKILGQLTQGRTVLWLLSGGSAINVAAAAMKELAGKDLSLLTVSLIDERYGPVGHEDSNWKLIEEAGIKFGGASLYPVLTGESQSDTTEAFANFLGDQFDTTDTVIGLLGIGTDGHTSGILPHSPAVNAPGLVAAYDGGQYQRITTTPKALKHIDEAILYMVGEPKWKQLDNFEQELSVEEQPAQALKKIPRVTIFTDRPQA